MNRDLPSSMTFPRFLAKRESGLDRFENGASAAPASDLLRWIYPLVASSLFFPCKCS